MGKGVGEPLAGRRTAVLMLAAVLALSALPAEAGALPTRSHKAKRAKKGCSKRKQLKGKRSHRCRGKALLGAAARVGPLAGSGASASEPPAPVQAATQPDPRCELVVLGPCSIYTEKFWEMRAKYAHLEYEFAVYPVSPECEVVCAAVEYYLYPDGTLGSNPWVPDACAPGGWRLTDPLGPPPC